MPLTVGILLFDEVEVLDFAGPFEVFSVTGRRTNLEAFRVVAVAERPGPVTARNGLSVNPAHSFAECPPLDILVVPGGFGTRALLKRPEVLHWVATRAAEAQLVLSVCTGALVLGAAGLLNGQSATTHHLAIEELRSAAPTATVHPDRRIVDNGRVILSAGVSAGIDMSLHVVAKLFGTDVARETARYMEYEGAWDVR